MRARLDVALLAALIVLTTTLGGTFSKLSINGSTLYVTEILLAAVAIAALARVGLDRGIAAIRILPLVPLAVYILAGAIATVRGLVSDGLELTIEDVGLLEYALLIPLVALVATSIARVDLLRNAILLGTGIATLIYLYSQASIRIFGESGPILKPEALAYGLYMCVFVAAIWTEIAHERSPHTGVIAIAGLGVVLIFLTNVRAVWIGLLLAIVVVVALTPRPRRLRFALQSMLAIVAAFVLAVGIEELDGSTQILAEIDGAILGVVDREGSTGFEGVDSGAVGGTGDRTDRRATGVPPAESANTRWRIAFWGESIERTLDQPFFGAGFGEPTRFVWEGLRYDFRDGVPTEEDSVTGPHNSLIYVLYRMGFPALIALLALLAIAAERARRAGIGDRVDAEQQARLAGLLGMAAAALGVAIFSDAFKGPYLSLLFWIPLGLLFVAGVVGVRPEAHARTGGPAHGSS